MTDPDGQSQGQISLFSQFDAILRRRNVGTWSLKTSSSKLTDILMQPGSGIILTREDLKKPLLTGPMYQLEPKWSADEDEIVISGFSDNQRLWDLLAFPATPNWNQPDNQAFHDSAYDVRSGLSESVMKYFVDKNGVRTAQGVSPLTTGPDLARGSLVTGRARFQFLGDLLIEMAVAGGDLNFDVVSNEFDVSVPVDHRKEQVFSVESGNLTSYSYKTTAPTATEVITAGAGDLELRSFVHVRDFAAEQRWRRHIEVLDDRRDSDDFEEMVQSANKTLADRAEISAVDLQAIDVPHRAFGVDWNLGDYVTVQDIDAVVRQVQITLDEHGETVTPTVDSVTTVSAQTLIRLYDSVRALQRKINDLQRTK